jgi:hypothetical protein
MRDEFREMRRTITSLKKHVSDACTPCDACQQCDAPCEACPSCPVTTCPLIHECPTPTAVPPPAPLPVLPKGPEGKSGRLLPKYHKFCDERTRPSVAADDVISYD